ncbi:MAG: carboxymuconolactone decarboxylase family protein [Candidatus Krumholzibacteriia bacterium]
MSSRAARFRAERERLNERVLGAGTRTTRRFFNLDGAAYRDGALDGRTKELLGLVASLVLRCDDCVTYHVIRCVELDVSEAELTEALDVGLVVGGSIVIPHLRRARELMDELLG